MYNPFEYNNSLIFIYEMQIAAGQSMYSPPLFFLIQNYPPPLKKIMIGRHKPFCILIFNFSFKLIELLLIIVIFLERTEEQ